MGVDWISLAALAGGEYPHSGGEFGGHVDYRLAVGDQALSDMSADAVAAFDCPAPIGMPPAASEHLLVSIAIGAKPTPIQDPFPVIDDLDRG
jgi:hypothetical protein